MSSASNHNEYSPCVKPFDEVHCLSSLSPVHLAWTDWPHETSAICLLTCTLLVHGSKLMHSPELCKIFRDCCDSACTIDQRGSLGHRLQLQCWPKRPRSPEEEFSFQLQSSWRSFRSIMFASHRPSHAQWCYAISTTTITWIAVNLALATHKLCVDQPSVYRTTSLLTPDYTVSSSFRTLSPSF